MQMEEKGFFARIFESSGIDWIFALIGIIKIPVNQRPGMEKRAEIETRLQQANLEAIRIMLSEAEKLFHDEEQRRSLAESKATNIIGFTAISSSFIVGFAQFLFGNTEILQPVRNTIIIFYIVIAFSIIMTVVLSMKALDISSYHKPRIDAFIELRGWNTETIYRSRLLDMLISYEYNEAVINDKLTFVIGAQIWFRNLIFLLLFLMIVLSTSLLITPYLVDNKKEPIPVLIVTQTIQQTATITPFLNMTLSPIITPSQTTTASPIISPSPTLLSSTTPSVTITTTSVIITPNIPTPNIPTP